jgi:CopG family transcriptional regulator/antitoxin EndoAI
MYSVYVLPYIFFEEVLKMSVSKKILVSLPDSLLKEVDEIVAMEKKNRSEFIREAMKLYIRERQKIEIKEQMIKGYQDMARINEDMAEIGVKADNYALNAYESFIGGE